MQFIPLDPSDHGAVQKMSALATEIVKDYFDPIIGETQNDYMIAHFQTPDAIAGQLAEGMHYYFVSDAQTQPLGFLAYKIEPKRLYLSKFYLHKNVRGHGYARKMLDFCITQAKKANCTLIELNCYKHNDQTLAIYEHLGFSRRRAEENDIGEGFVMDDYVYGLNL